MIDIEREGAVFVLRWADGADNRFNDTSIAALDEALDRVEAADGPKALVVTGAGKFFSNGLDLAWMAEGCADVEVFLRSVHRLLARVLCFPAVTVAAINGHAFAGGAMLAVAHDHRVMRVDRGYWCTPEVDLGMRFSPGMNDLLSARLDTGTAHRALVLAERFDAPAATAAGIVHETAEEDRVVDVAVAAAAAHAEKAGPVLGAVKRDLYPRARASLLQGAMPLPLDQ